MGGFAYLGDAAIALASKIIGQAAIEHDRANGNQLR